MTRKTYQGEKNDKSRTMSKLVSAVGIVLENSGYTGLTIANIAKTAEVDRKLIALYFGSLDKLVETYIIGKDYWVSTSTSATEKLFEIPDKGSKEFAASALLDQFEHLMQDVEMQKLLLWQISEKTAIMAQVNQEREKLSSLFFSFSDQESVGKNVDLRAVSSILIAAIYFLVLQSKTSVGTFCEIDITTDEGIGRIKNAVKTILNWAYESKGSS